MSCQVMQSSLGKQLTSLCAYYVHVFVGTEESGHDYNFVDFQLCLEIESLSFPNILKKPFESHAWFDDSCIDLVINKHIFRQGTAEIC